MAVNCEEGRPHRVATGAGLIVAAVFLMAAQDALIKYVSADLTLGQIFLLRSMLVLPVLTVIAWPEIGRHWRSAFGTWLLARAGLLTLMYLSLYAVIALLPLSTLAAAFYTGPLFITLLSAPLLGERVGLSGWAAISVGFLGVLVLLRPGTESFTPIAAVPVLSGLCYALAAILARGKCQGQSSVAMALALNIVLLAAGALMVASGQAIGIADRWSFLVGAWMPMDARAWQTIGTLAVLMVGIGLALAAAYQSAPPAVIASFDYSYLIFATLFGLFLFDETPDIQTIVGMVLIAGAGLSVLPLNMKTDGRRRAGR